MLNFLLSPNAPKEIPWLRLTAPKAQMIPARTSQENRQLLTLQERTGSERCSGLPSSCDCFIDRLRAESN